MRAVRLPPPGDLRVRRCRLPGVADVQTAIDELRRQSCLHVVFRPSMSVREMHERLPKSGAVSICFEAGAYRLEGPLVIEGLDRAVLHGAGARLVAGNATTALRIARCDAVAVEGLSLEGAAPAAGSRGGDTAELPAVLEIDATPQVRLARLDLAIGGARTLGGAALRVGTPSAGTKTAALQVGVLDCTVEVGEAQVGLLVLNPGALAVRGNRLQRARKGDAGQFGCVVSGERIGTLQVDGNVIGGVATGLLVRGEARDTKGELKALVDDTAVAARVVVTDNVIALDAPAEAAKAASGGLTPNRLEMKAVVKGGVQAGAGIAIGAATSVRVTGNEVSIDPKAGAELGVPGVLVQGALGAHLVLRDNRFAGTAAGIALAVDEPAERRVLWLVEANLGSALAGNVLEASEAILKFLTRRDNIETA